MNTLQRRTIYKITKPLEIGWGIKNILRIYTAGGLAGNVKNTEPRSKLPYSYKKNKGLYSRATSHSDTCSRAGSAMLQK